MPMYGVWPTTGAIARDRDAARPRGPTPVRIGLRFVVTNLNLPAETLYDVLYCPRGEAQNRIKEMQPDLFGTRLPRQLAASLCGLAYALMQRLEDPALAGTELARAIAATIRVKLLKIGATVIRNTRRIQVLFASHHLLRGGLPCRCAFGLP